MNYIKKAGVKEFFIAIVCIALLGTVGSYISFVLPSYKVFGHITGIALIVVYGYFVLTRYCAVYSYYIGEDYIKITRTVGARNSELKYFYKDIHNVSKEKPVNTKVKNYTRFIIKNKNAIYIVPKSNKTFAIMIEDDKKKSILKALSNNFLKKNQYERNG